MFPLYMYEYCNVYDIVLHVLWWRCMCVEIYSVYLRCIVAMTIVKECSLAICNDIHILPLCICGVCSS